jgi:hypothetical protein
MSVLSFHFIIFYYFSDDDEYVRPNSRSVATSGSNNGRRFFEDDDDDDTKPYVPRRNASAKGSRKCDMLSIIFFLIADIFS